MDVSRPPLISPHRAARGAAGFTLLEVLVAVVVLSFGVLGVVGLQAAALQANKDARFQSSAARLARELADLMRNNNVIAATTTNNPYLIANFTPPAPSVAQNCDTAGPCTPIQLGQFDVADWLGRVSTELPGARVVVCLDAQPYTGAGIAQWGCTAGANAIVYIKIGWTRQGFNRSAAGASAVTLATDASSFPAIVQAIVP